MRRFIISLPYAWNFFMNRKANASKVFVEKLNIGLIKGISFGA